IGNVVCTMKNATLVGYKLLLVQPIDRRGRDRGRAFVAIDAVGAGAGGRFTGAVAARPASPSCPVRLRPRPLLSALWTPSTSQKLASEARRLAPRAVRGLE